MPRIAAVSKPDPDALVIELGPALGARGRVVDAATGSPIADARVRAHSEREPIAFWSSEPSPRDVRTDVRGEFLLADLPDEPVSLFVDAPGFAARYDGPFEPTARGGARTIELVRGASIVGRVADASGRALANETLQLSAIDVKGQESRVWCTMSDTDGRFEFVDLSPGRYQVMRELAHDMGAVYDLTTDVSVAGTDRAEVELRPRGTLRLTGTVRLAPRLRASAELPSTLGVTAHRASSSLRRGAIASDGRFEFEGLEAGEWFVEVWRHDGHGGLRLHGEARVELAPGSTAVVELELAPSTR